MVLEALEILYFIYLVVKFRVGVIVKIERITFRVAFHGFKHAEHDD